MLTFKFVIPEFCDKLQIVYENICVYHYIESLQRKSSNISLIIVKI